MASSDDAPGCGFGEMFEDVPQCPSQTPCPTLTVTCPMGQMDLYDCKPMYEYDEEAMACMLAAFRDRTPGRYDIDGDMDYGLYTGQSRLQIRIRNDGLAIHTWCWSTDGGTDWTNSNVRNLAAPAYFDGCANEVAPASRYGCLVHGLTEVMELPLCE